MTKPTTNGATPDSAYVTDFSVLESLASDFATLNITMPDGKKQRFRLGILGYSEYNEIGLEVLDPTVPATRYNQRTDTKEANPDDVSYRAALAKANDERRVRRLAQSLEYGGLTLPGATLADKARALKALHSNVITALLVGFQQAHFNVEGALEKRADTFHGLRSDGEPDIANVSYDAEPVESAAADGTG